MFVYLVTIILSYSCTILSLPVSLPHSISRVPRAVFDIIPSHTAVSEDTYSSKVFISGSSCPCPDGNSQCVLDQNFECKKTLNILPSKESVFSGHHKRHRRKMLKKLFKKWIQEGGKHS